MALGLIQQNRRFLLGQELDPRVRGTIERALLAEPEVERVTHVRIEDVGPRRLRAVETRLTAPPAVARHRRRLPAGGGGR